MEEGNSEAPMSPDSSAGFPALTVWIQHPEAANAQGPSHPANLGGGICLFFYFGSCLEEDRISVGCTEGKLLSQIHP